MIIKLPWHLKAPEQYIKTHQALLFLLIWFAVNLLTAAFTELYKDEAYYWLFSRFLDWGYFDHPPMVAILIKSGSALMTNELGLRLPFVLLLTLAIGLVFKLARPVSPWLFFITVFSIFSLNIHGFLGVPDIPLVFFSVLFFYCYRSYLQNPGYWEAFKIGLVAAALLYSKYHGVLVIGFTVLSNPGMFRQKSFYLALLWALILLMPHIWWQYQQGFPSLKYHLIERATHYQFSNTLDYILGNIPFHGPWASIILLWAAVRYKPNNKWEKALKWNLAGVFIFFFLMTFRMVVEPNWTILMIIPMLIIGLKKLQEWKNFMPVYLKGCYLFAALIMVFRLHIIHPFFEIQGDRVWEFHGHKQFAEAVFNASEGMQITANRYQEASILSFYSPGQATLVPALNMSSRRNQFDLWKFDTLLCGNRVLYVNNHLCGEYPSGNSEICLTIIDNFLPVSNFTMHLGKVSGSDLPAKLIFNNGQCNFLDVTNIYLRIEYFDPDKVLLETRGFPKVLSIGPNQVTFPLDIILPKGLVPEKLIFSLYFQGLDGTRRLLPIPDS